MLYIVATLKRKARTSQLMIELGHCSEQWGTIGCYL